MPYTQPPAGGELALEPPVDPGPARIDLYTPNRIVVEAELGAPGLMVLSEVWYPGWHALDNGLQVPIQRVAGTLRGVFLERGSHIVEFRYTPWTAWAGAAISGATVLALLAYPAYWIWRRT